MGPPTVTWRGGPTQKGLPMRGDSRPTMVDVASAAGVSLKTVSRVINDEPHVNAETQARVRAAIETLGYHRNAIAASLRSGSIDTIGLIVADLRNAFYTAVAAAVSAVAVSHGMQVIIASSESDPDAERALALDLCQRRVGGLIIMPAGTDQSYLQPEMDRGTQMVFLDRPGVGVSADAVLIDNRGGAYRAVTTLLDAGHRRIAVLGDHPHIHTMRERVGGAVDAHRDRGLTLEDDMVVSDLHSSDDARETILRLLSSPNPPTAVFCCNNRSTIGVLQATMPLHLTLAIAAFDDFELSDLLPTSLTVVDYDTEELGRSAARTLLGRLAGTTDGPASTVLIPTTLARRGLGPHAETSPGPQS